MDLDVERYRLPPGEPVRLEATPTLIPPPYRSKAHYKAELEKRVKAAARLQRALSAERRHALLVILQSVDAGGKDGTIRHVFSGLNPQGCEVSSFGPPTPLELRHDFLWRTSLRLPPRGSVGVFNRSYYEEVLVVRVHPEMLVSQGLGAGDPGCHVWRGRFRSIVDHEAHLERNGTRVLKLFLHVSAEEQRRRLLRRIERPEKRWKIDAADIAERSRHADYLRAYEACLEATGAAAAPWYVLPADDKKTVRLLAAELVLQALTRLKPRYPPTSEERAANLAKISRRLQAECLEEEE